MISTGHCVLRRFVLFHFLDVLIYSIGNWKLQIYLCRFICVSYVKLSCMTLILSILKQIPEEEKNLGPHDRLIHVYHFMKDPNQNQQIQNFGDPFLMVIREGETAAEVMERIQRKLRVPDEFSKVIYPSIITIYYIMDFPRAPPPVFPTFPTFLSCYMLRPAEAPE